MKGQKEEYVAGLVVQRSRDLVNNRDASTYAETNVLTGIIQSGVTTVFVIKPIVIRHKFGNRILVQGENEISDLFFRA